MSVIDRAKNKAQLRSTVSSFDGTVAANSTPITRPGPFSAVNVFAVQETNSTRTAILVAVVARASKYGLVQSLAV
jgi:hypothetical protein